MIKAVIFDIDGVLLDSYEANFKFFSDLMIHFGYLPPTREEFPSLFHRTMRDIIRILTKSVSEEEIEKIWQAGARREVLYPHNLLTNPEKMDEVIHILSKDYVLGIVTSRQLNSVYESTQLSKLKDYFKITITVEDTKNHKPHPEPLLLAAEKLNISPVECVYVGDAESDAIAARGAGMKSILYSKNIFKDADACTENFDELPKIIKIL